MSGFNWDRFFQKLSASVEAIFRKKTNSKKPQSTNIEMRFDLTREPKQNLGLPPNAIPGLSVIKELVRNLIYKQIDDLIGLEIEVSSMATSSKEIQNKIEQYGYSLNYAENFEGGFLKYGILDLKFDLIETNSPIEKQSVRFLKDMGFLVDKVDVNDSIFPDAGIGFLQDMLDETKTNKLIFKIFLESTDYRGIRDNPKQNIMELNSEQYFPNKFVVRDACITNCTLIWLNKHFYL
ncbi:MAG: hypothetical protein KIT34_01370 [Cyanobacteria bacterium TGS_CYA1]|nr:hypothetical protein [Cyanobacteria bacterium TGS_CYA1]